MEISVDTSRPSEGFIDHPQNILNKYIHTLPNLHRLIANSPANTNSVIADARNDIEALSHQDTIQLTTALFSITGNEKPSVEAGNEQDTRDGALALLKLIDLSRIKSRVLLETYLDQIHRTPADAEAFGSVYSLLGAGHIIAPYLPERFSTRPLIEAWNPVIANCLISIPIQQRRETYLELREMLNGIISNLPVVQLSPVEPARTETQPSLIKPRIAVKKERTMKKPDDAEDPSLKIFREVKRGVFEQTFTSSELPWLRENMLIRLDHAILRSGDTGLYLGMCIAKGDPVDAMEEMDSHQRKLALNTFYTVLPDFITRHSYKNIYTLSDQRSAARIHYTSNPGGQRLYFTEAGKIDNEPVIIIIGMCDKARQIPLLRAFTTTSIKDLKRTGRI